MTAIDWKSIITGAINADTTISAKAPAEARNAPPNCLRSDRCVQTRTRLSSFGNSNRPMVATKTQMASTGSWAGQVGNNESSMAFASRILRPTRAFRPMPNRPGADASCGPRDRSKGKAVCSAMSGRLQMAG